MEITREGAAKPGRREPSGSSADGPLTKATKRASWHWTLALSPCGAPLKTRIEPWEYDREMYKRRNEVERLFRCLKGFRRIFSQFEKPDAMFLGFLSFVLVVDGLRGLC